MPKPYLIYRPTGIYARFLVPKDLRAQIGNRFIVRNLRALHGDESRLVASTVGLLLSQVFDALRRGRTVGDLDKLLESALGAFRNGQAKTWEVEGVTPQGHPFRIKTDGTPEDNASGRQALAVLMGSTAPKEAETPPSVLFSKASADYIGDLQRAVENNALADKTCTESAFALRILSEVIKVDKPVTDINADDMRQFFDVVMVWPPYASTKPEFKGKTALQIAEIARKKDLKKPSPFTVEKHRQRLAAFFNHLINAGIMNRNPVHGVAGLVEPDAEEDSGRPFTAQELATIFEPVQFKDWASKYPHRWFGTMLGLFSGARVKEVGQLEVSDIEQVESVWGFSVRAKRTKSKRVKNKQSRRFVPIADAVINAGFLDYIDDVKAEGHTRIFPNLPNNGTGYGVQLSKQFCTYLRERGIVEPGSGFHYFRHGLLTFFDTKEVKRKTVTQITGHKKKDADDESVIDDFYVKKSIAERKEALEMWKPNITLPTYTKGQFKHALKSAK